MVGKEVPRRVLEFSPAETGLDGLLLHERSLTPWESGEEPQSEFKDQTAAPWWKRKREPVGEDVGVATEREDEGTGRGRMS